MYFFHININRIRECIYILFTIEYAVDMTSVCVKEARVTMKHKMCLQLGSKVKQLLLMIFTRPSNIVQISTKLLTC